MYVYMYVYICVGMCVCVCAVCMYILCMCVLWYITLLLLVNYSLPYSHNNSCITHSRRRKL